MCSTCIRLEARLAAARVSGSSPEDPDPGAVAQLVEHLHGMEGVARSIRVSSTERGQMAACPDGYAFGGLIAAEGSFTTKRQGLDRHGRDRIRFVFSIKMADRDTSSLSRLHAAMGAGSITLTPPRKAGWLPTAGLDISGYLANQTATIPFCDQYLLPGAKRRQYDAWKRALLESAATAKRWGTGPSTCRRDGCDRPVRGRGLCRSHYYEETGW